jgi:SRSO17 transposase
MASTSSAKSDVVSTTGSAIERRPAPAFCRSRAITSKSVVSRDRRSTAAIITTRVRVRTAPIRGAAARPEETLLIEWPHGEAAPTKYWLSNVDRKISFRELVDIAKMRWRIERDYQDLKQEIGLDHYEGRGWRGFHHHATLCIAAYGFLISERETIPPSAPRSSGMFAKNQRKRGPE